MTTALGNYVTVDTFLDDLLQDAQRRRERGVAHLGGQVVLGCEVVVEAAVDQARFLHQVRDPDGVDALRAEHAPGRLDDVLPIPGLVFLGDPWHVRPPVSTVFDLFKVTPHHHFNVIHHQ